jgi:Tol biopolymer transport system component
LIGCSDTLQKSDAASAEGLSVGGNAAVRATMAALLVSVVGIGLAAPAAATYPGRNGRIAFGQYEEPEVSLRTVRPDGSAMRVLAEGGAFQDSAWSPNGRRIVYRRGASAFLTHQLEVMRADGTGRQRILSRAGELFDPSFLPGGQRVVFSVHNNRELQAYTVGIDGSDIRRFAPKLDGSIAGVVFSPNGRRVAFAYKAAGAKDYDIYTRRVDGGGLRNLTPAGAHEGAPDWSPDGRRLVFVRMAADFSRTDLVRMNADGSDQRRLTDRTARPENPVWSPNGRWIAYNRHHQTDSIRLIRPDGSNDHKAIAGTVHRREPSWQPLPE